MYFSSIHLFLVVLEGGAVCCACFCCCGVVFLFLRVQINKWF